MLCNYLVEPFLLYSRLARGRKNEVPRTTTRLRDLWVPRLLSGVEAHFNLVGTTRKVATVTPNVMKMLITFISILIMHQILQLINSN
jgi:hypothetical protein